MSIYTQTLYQIVFGTRHHKDTLTGSDRDRLYEYIAGILRRRKCLLYEMNGGSNHIHILTHLHPGSALANVIREIKVASSDLISETGMFPAFDGWQGGYGAFTYDIQQKDELIEYVRNHDLEFPEQTFRDEYLGLLKQHKIQYDEKFMA